MFWYGENVKSKLILVEKMLEIHESPKIPDNYSGMCNLKNIRKIHKIRENSQMSGS